MAKKKYMVLPITNDDDHLSNEDIVENDSSSSSMLNINTNNNNRSNNNDVVVDQDDDEVDIDSDATTTLLQQQQQPPTGVGDTIIQFNPSRSMFDDDGEEDPQLDNPFESGYRPTLTNWRDIIRTTRSVNRNTNLPRSMSIGGTMSNTSTATVATVTTSPPLPSTTSHFPFPSTLSTRWENAQLKEKDTLVIRHPDGKVSLGLNETKFYHHTSTGEHDPNGLYAGLADPDILLQHYNQNGIPSTLQDQDHIYLESYGMYDGFQNGGFETYRRKKFLVSLITCEVFYCALLMAQIMHFNSMLLMLILVILSDIMGVYAVSKNKPILLSLFVFLDGLSMFVQIISQLYSPLFLLRMIVFMIACRVRNDMVLYSSAAPVVSA
ncbi:hypothetical protein SAMD00019534_000660, partial [Acytostelium subglobosum LB1]|uniref:hypothetical protein n=1 Tax=Acytostelium subglobosum LB1 TaxID=1410327 RepID=UPI000644BDFE